LFLRRALSQQHWVNAEIAARMMVQDYPDTATAKDCLERVMELWVAVEAVNVT